MIRVDRLTEASEGLCTVFFSNGEEQVFSEEELCAFHIISDRVYTEEQYRDLIDSVFCQRAKEKVMPYVLFSRRTEKQVFDKIISLGFPASAAEALVRELTDKEYLNDRAYCRSYVKKAAEKKGYSRNRIRLELKQKGLSDALIEEAFEELSFEDTDAARMVLNKKLRTAGERDYNKLCVFLMRKGFSGDTARKVIQETEIE